jgi:RimJ/RimL family protein N-acetyltransferase
VTEPPYRIVTERLVVRCWEPRDAPLLKDAVDSSIEELRAWMPWAHDDPQPLPEKVALLRRFRGQFDLGQDFVYGIFSADEAEVVGGTGLHRRAGREEDSFEIGYWIRTSRAGRGLCTESTAALTRVAFELCGVDRVEIRVDPANERSARIPLKLGFAEEATLRRRLPAFGTKREPQDVAVYSLFRDRFAETPSATAAVEAYDALGAHVL